MPSGVLRALSVILIVEDRLAEQRLADLDELDDVRGCRGRERAQLVGDAADYQCRDVTVALIKENDTVMSDTVPFCG